MLINGPYQACKEWISDAPTRQADTVLYKTGALGKVTALVFPRELIEWVFPPAEVVTVTMLKSITRNSILVNDWTL